MKALITGICGQDGSYLAELLEAEGVDVYGICHKQHAHTKTRRAITPIDICDRTNVDALIREVKPNECYHLAAFHRSSQIIGVPQRALDVAEEKQYLDTNLVATHGLLSSLLFFAPECRVFLAGSCHQFGDPVGNHQDELTPMHPTSMYGITKLAAMQLGQFYREKHGLFVANGILFNHESPRRGPSFITSQMARGAVECLRGKQTEIVIGNLDAKVDWGFAGDYVRAMRMMLAANEPDDFVISSGELHTVGEFLQEAFNLAHSRFYAGKKIRLADVDTNYWRFVKEDPSAHRPVSRAPYYGDSGKIQRRLGWERRVGFHGIVAKMMEHYLPI